MLSIDKISTLLGDRLYYSYNVLAFNPKRFYTLPSNIKLIIRTCGEIFMILPRVEKFGLLVNG